MIPYFFCFECGHLSCGFAERRLRWSGYSCSHEFVVVFTLAGFSYSSSTRDGSGIDSNVSLLFFGKKVMYPISKVPDSSVAACTVLSLCRAPAFNCW